jgi:hypothetical protein
LSPLEAAQAIPVADFAQRRLLIVSHGGERPVNALPPSQKLFDGAMLLIGPLGKGCAFHKRQLLSPDATPRAERYSSSRH